MSKFITVKMPNAIQIGLFQIVPEGCQANWSPAFPVDMSNRHFRAMVLCDLFDGKSYQGCSATLAMCFGGMCPEKKSTVTSLTVQKISVWVTGSELSSEAGVGQATLCDHSQLR